MSSTQSILKTKTQWIIRLINKPIFPAIFAASFFLSPASGLAVEFAGTLDGVSITNADGTNAPPTASFSYTVDENNVAFDASGSVDSDGSITEYKWDFGDGTFSVGITTNHQFTTAPPYLVTLTVVDNTGGVTIRQTNVAAGGVTLAEQSADHSYKLTTDLFSSDARVLGQSFKVTENGTAKSIVLYTTDDSIANITVKIGTTTDLSTSYLGEGSLAYDGFSPGEITIDLDAGVRLSVGTTYYLAVYADGSYANRISLLGSASYSYGSGAYHAANGWPIIDLGDRFDLYFKVAE